MATKWRSKSISLLLLGCAFVIWTLTLFAAANVYKNSVYFGQDSYFKGSAFSREISSIYRFIQQHHLESPNFADKTPEQQLGRNDYNNLKQEAERTVHEKLNNVNRKYSDRINAARNRSDNAEMDRLDAEKETKIAELNKEKDTVFEQKLKTAVAAKQKEFVTAKMNLDNRKNSLYYALKNLSSGETYSNIDQDTLQKALDSQDIIYTLNLPNTEMMSRVSSDMSYNQIKGTFYILNPTQGSGIIQSDYLSHLTKKQHSMETVYLLIALLIVTLALSFYLRKQRANDIALTDVKAGVTKRFPLDVRAWCTFIATAALFGISMDNDIFYLSPTFVSLYQIFVVAISTALLVIVFYGIRGAISLMKNPEKRAEQWNSSITASFWQTVKEALEQRGLRFKLLVFMAIIGIMGFLPVCVAASEFEDVVVVFAFAWYIMFIIFVLPYIMRKVKQLRKIIKGVEQMANGDFGVTLPAKGNGQLSRMATHINNMKQGLQLSLEKQRVSDRLKTELITNVSHDLKTPLTSIINFVDLLKNESLSAEQSSHYIEVLDRKTQRLKVLIDDLFEASKMASGATELFLEKVDVAALLNQALAEFSDKIDASPLNFRVNLEKPHIYALLDGKKTWRVFENLISNALKYAMPGTRVYVNLTESESKVVLIIQNISVYEFNFDARELFERFKTRRSVQTHGRLRTRPSHCQKHR
ncbi:HAMP domain-containing sensor histidine kinase [Paenibacillus sp. V4I7]|uniref:sensor histidine kinase n=1 Tax=Paenibacillus sp. V4I7 TaxID=3042307 RepID=UPI0027871D80|nr:HAMP domain-containing sensor histidine kinase [Paenibacillus sp. V4I7]MDQ0901029.1 signal transduction histidine kinase [Paenibacillus sp. V4I7]